MFKRLCVSALALSAAAMAAGRSDLNGTWQLDRSRSTIGDDKLKDETLDIHQKEDSVRIADALTEADGKQRKSDIQCNTLGKECKLKGEQVSAWYNGEALVIMETLRNDVVVKRRLKASDDGRTLSVEVTRMASSGEKSESFSFSRQPTATAQR